MDPTNGNLFSGGYVYTSTYLMAVSKSTDAGTSWSRDTLNTVYSTCDAIRVDPTNSNVVYAGGYTGIYKSVDAGNTWSPSGTGLSGTVYDIAVNAQRATTVYAGTSSGVFKSTDAGLSWTNTGCTSVYAVLIDPTNPLTVYAGTYTGVYKSTSGGGGWTAMNTGLQDLYVTSLNIFPNTWLICGTKGAGMYRWNLVVGADERGESGADFGISCAPNPARRRTVVRYALPRTAFVTVALYDVQGRLAATLVNETKPAGVHEADWDKGALPSGVYFCRLIAPGIRQVEKVVLID